MEELPKTLRQLLKMRDLANASEQLSKILAEQFEITSFSYTAYQFEPTANKPLHYDYVTNDLTEWHQHFIENGYEAIDRIGETVRNSYIPILWDLEASKASASGRCLTMFEEALDYGLGRGLSIPIHGPHGSFAILVCHEKQGQTCLLNIRDTQFSLQEIAICFSEVVRHCLCKAISHNEKYDLSSREMQCLLLTSQGLTAAQIASKIHITERTVNFHLQNINRKFGTKSKHQSVNRARQLKIL